METKPAILRDGVSPSSKALAVDATCWINASAGSGKTTLLVSRIGRLLLHGVSGGKILCVTFTKGAALEMQERLNQRMNLWATCSEEDLREELSSLMGRSPSQEDKIRARNLRQGMLEDPVTIQTLHSFCHDVLMRFPMEARLKVPLDIWDQIKAQRMWEQALQDFLVRVEGESPEGRAVQRLVHHGVRLPLMLGEMFQARLLPQRARQGEGLNFCLEAFLREHPNPPPPRPEGEREDGDWWSKWGSSPRGSLVYCGLMAKKIPKSLALNNSLFQQWYTHEQALMARVSGALEEGKKAQIHGDGEMIFQRVMALYQKTKGKALDFDDLTLKTVELFEDSAYSGWISHSFYHALNHILVDEAQDTSTHQWKILRYLMEAVLQDPHRTACVVGDPKQSIYGFQGADPEGFFLMRNFVKAWVLAQGGAFYDVALTVSFRSAPPILKVVNGLFSHKNPMGIPFSEHTSFHRNRPGLVEMWPLYESQGEDPELDLAQAWVNTLEEWKKHPFFLPSQGRPMGSEDIMILLPRRTAFFKNLQEKLYLSGWLRHKDLSHRDNPVLRMMVSWCQCLWNPKDDLALAALIRGLDPQGKCLFQAAYQRGKQTLWHHVVHLSEHLPEKTAPGTSFFLALRRYMERVRGERRSQRLWDLVSTWIYHEGGEDFLHTLSPCATQAIEAFLSALMHWPDPDDAVGFLHWVQREDTIFKSSQSGGLRLLTIHGAKGTQAPIVIVPDLPPDLDKEDAEYWRLLYVAMTRAQDRLYFSSRKDSPWYQALMESMEGMQAKAYGEKEAPPGWKYRCGDPEDPERPIPCMENLQKPTEHVEFPRKNHGDPGDHGENKYSQDTPLPWGEKAPPSPGTFLWLWKGLAEENWSYEGWIGNPQDQDAREGKVQEEGSPKTRESRGEGATGTSTSLEERDGVHPQDRGKGGISMVREKGTHGRGNHGQGADKGMESVGQASYGQGVDKKASPWNGQDMEGRGNHGQGADKGMESVGQASYGQGASPSQEIGASGIYLHQEPLSYIQRCAHRRRGAALHQLLEELPFMPREQWFSVGMNFLKNQGVDSREASSWAQRLTSLLRRRDLYPLFFKARGEVEWSNLRERRRMDRVWIQPQDIWIVDFKSDEPADKGNWYALPHVQQMEGYADLMQPLYPEKRIHLGILWLKSGVLQWHPQSHGWDTPLGESFSLEP